MPDEYSDILKDLTREVSATAKMTVADARAMLVQYMPLLTRWTAEAQAAEAAGNHALAKKKRQSIKHVKNQAALDLAKRGVDVTNKVERVIVGLIDKALLRI